MANLTESLVRSLNPDYYRLKATGRHTVVVEFLLDGERWVQDRKAYFVRDMMDLAIYLFGGPLVLVGKFAPSGSDIFDLAEPNPMIGIAVQLKTKTVIFTNHPDAVGGVDDIRSYPSLEQAEQAAYQYADRYRAAHWEPIRLN